MNGLRIFDGVLPNPRSYREEVLKLEFRTYDFGHCMFHGIAVGEPSPRLLGWIMGQFQWLYPTLTFFRKSPLGQQEPHFIHTDVDMGQWSGILYLNPGHTEEDGTSFWTHKGTGAIESLIPHERSEEGKDPENWTLREKVPARFNRLVMFPSSYFHSRAIHDNYGQGNDARLTQVVFGTGVLQ